MADIVAETDRARPFAAAELPVGKAPSRGCCPEANSGDSEHSERAREVVASGNKTRVSSAKPSRRRLLAKSEEGRQEKLGQAPLLGARLSAIANQPSVRPLSLTNEAVMAEHFINLPQRPPLPVSIQAPQVQLMPQRALPADLEQQIAQLIRTNGDPETLLSAIAIALGQSFQVDGCLVAVRDSFIKDALNRVSQSHPVKNALSPSVYAYPSRTQALFNRDRIRRLDFPVVEAQLDECEILAICDLEASDRREFKTQLWEALQVRAVLAIKTRFQGQVNGEIVVMRSQLYCWTDSDRELLKAVSDQVAIAISQVVQTRVIGSLQKQVGAFAQHRHLIKELTMAIHNPSDLNQILKLAIEGLVETLQVARGSILLLKYLDPLFATRTSAAAKRTLPSAKVTIVSTASNQQSDRESSKTLLNRVFWLSECALCASAFTQAPNPLAIADRRTLPTLEAQTGFASLSRPETLPAMLVIPLMGATGGSSHSGTVLGFIVLQDVSPRSWLPDELELLEVVAAQVSTAIIQSQKIQHVQAIVEERTAQLQRSLDVQAKLYEKTRQQVDQLRRLNQLKDEFLSTMSHELRTPLTSMTLAIRMLRQPGLSDERRDKYLDILEQQCLQETNLINDLLTLQQLESQASRIQVQKIDLKNLIHDLQQGSQLHWATKGLKLAVDLPGRALKLETDFDSLNRILQELLTNAGKYSDPETTVFLRASYQPDRNIPQIVLSLTNTGAGISPEELPHIFDKFRRGAGVTQQAIAGTGLGLALVKCLVQHLNGTITVTSHPLGHTPAWETCFTLTLPQQFDNTKVV